MLEWLKRHAWKACIRQKRITGSNPVLSAIRYYRAILILKNSTMKRFFVVLAMTGSLSLGMVSSMQAQDTNVVTMFGQEEEMGMAADEDTVGIAVQGSLPEVLSSGWAEGNDGLMYLVAVVFILGLAFCVERIVSLSLSDIDVRRLLEKIEAALEKGDVEGAVNLCHNTRGPIAAVCEQGLMRIDEDMDVVERMIVLFQHVQDGILRKRCRWVKMFIVTTLAVGVLGTVVGIAMALGQLQYGDVFSVSVFAKGIKAALFPLIFALLSAIVLYLFYNCIQNKIEILENRMKEASITLLDMMMKYNWKYKR